MPDDLKTATFSAVTSTYLLECLKDSDHKTVWEQFVARYRPMILQYARRLGLNEQDAEDAAQQALTGFCTAYRAGRYQRAKGRLRDWLFGIAKHQILKILDRRHQREVQITQRTGQSDFFASVPAEDQLTEIWQYEWRQAVLRQCMEETRKEFDVKTVQAFEMFARDGLPAKQVAQQLGTTENAVYLAKRRVLAKVRELLPQMEQIW